MLLMTLISTALTVAQPAPAAVSAGDASARLSQPREVRQVFDGRNWACDGDGACLGRGGGGAQPLMRECRRFVARFGPVSAFGRGDQMLTAAELAQCNTAAAR